MFKSEAVFGAFAKHWQLGLGLSIIASVALLPRGLIGLPQQVADRLLGGRGHGVKGTDKPGVAVSAAHDD